MILPKNQKMIFYVLGFKTFGEFMLSWRPYVEKLARRKGFNCPDEIEDIVQDIFFDFWSREYNKIFDPNKAKWSTFFTTFVHYRLLNRFTKKMKDPLNKPIPIIQGVEEGQMGLDSDKYLADPFDAHARLHYEEFISQVKEQIMNRFPNRRGFVPSKFICKGILPDSRQCKHENQNPQKSKVCPHCGGKKWKAVPPEGDELRVERSHLVIFEQLILSHSRKQIAQFLKFSEATVSIMIRDLAETPLMTEMWEFCHGISNEVSK